MNKKKAIAKLEYLITAREEYLSLELKALIREKKRWSYWSQTEHDKAIYSEISGMRNAVAALKGKDMEGWLPSWRWDEYQELHQQVAIAIPNP